MIGPRDNRILALIVEVAFPTGAGLKRLFAGFVPCNDLSSCGLSGAPGP